MGQLSDRFGLACIERGLFADLVKNPAAAIMAPLSVQRFGGGIKIP